MNITELKKALDSFEGIAADLGRRTDLLPPQAVVSSALPEPLRLLYSLCDGGDAIVVDLFSQEQVLTSRVTAPFSPDWFPFGSDQHGVVWLCGRKPEDTLWFTSWDHECGAEIDGAVFCDLSAMILDAYQEALERRADLGDELVVSRIPAEAKMKAALQLKSLAGLSTQEALTKVATVPFSLAINRASEAKVAMDKLRAVGVKCHLHLDFF